MIVVKIMVSDCDAKTNNLFLIPSPIAWHVVFMWRLSTHFTSKRCFKCWDDFEHWIVTEHKAWITHSDYWWLTYINLIIVFFPQFVRNLIIYLLVSILCLKNATSCSDANFSKFNKKVSPSPLKVSKSLFSCIFSTVGVGFASSLLFSLVLKNC